MADPQHYVVIGTGPAGDEAAAHLRQRDPGGRITLVSAGKLLFIRRYQLHKVFNGIADWRELLVHPPEYFEQHNIMVRRNTVVTQVDPHRRILGLRHKEEIHYDKLLVATGGGGYLPEGLREYRHLIHRFGSFEQAVAVRQRLSDGGRILLLGGDMMGIELARHLIAAGFAVTIIGGDQLFWPHEIANENRPQFIEALRNMGAEVVLDKVVRKIEEGKPGLPARRIVFVHDEEISGDVVLAFCGLMPVLDFMAGASLHIEKGLLVNPQLATINARVWAAGDVCQIWSPEENRYRFSYEWKSVKNMGRVAAINMTGGDEAVSTFSDSTLSIGDDGQLRSPFWDYD